MGYASLTNDLPSSLLVSLILGSLIILSSLSNFRQNNQPLLLE